MNRDKWTTRSPTEPLSMKKIPSCMYVYVTNARRIHRERERERHRTQEKSESRKAIMTKAGLKSTYGIQISACMYVQSHIVRRCMRAGRWRLGASMWRAVGGLRIED